MTIGNIIVIAWFVLVIVFVGLLGIYAHSSKDYSKIRIQILEGVINIMFAVIPFMIMIGIFLSFFGI